MKGKNIIYLHQYFAFPDSNAGTRSYDLSLFLLDKGYSVHIITGSGYLNSKYIKKKGWNEIAKDGIMVHALNHTVNNKTSFVNRVIGFVYFLYKATLKIIALKGDVVIATSTPLTIGIPAIIKKIIHKTPYIFEVRDVWPDAPIALGILRNKILIILSKALEKICYSFSIHIITLSPDMTKNLKRKNIDTKKITTIPNISHHKRFQVKTIKDVVNGFSFNKNKKIVLYTGTFGIVNNLRYMVELAFYAKTIDPNILFICVGEGKEKEDILRISKEKNVYGENFFILPPVNKKILPFIVKNATVCCSWVANIPELWANSANKFFDTLAAGKPIVINYKGWQSEVIREKQIGYILPVHLSKVEVEKFIDYLLDEDAIKFSSNNSSITGRESYSLEVAGEKYIKILNKIF